MDTKKVIKNWVDGARRDMSVAKLLFDGKAYPQCLFWCHLVIEKLLKALVVQKTGKHAPYIHNLQKLADMLDDIDFSEKQHATFAELTSFNQAGRYADDAVKFIEKCTFSYSKKYFNITQTLYKWLLKKISLKK